MNVCTFKNHIAYLIHDYIALMHTILMMTTSQVIDTSAEQLFFQQTLKILPVRKIVNKKHTNMGAGVGRDARHLPSAS
jgi:hypothetical protein